MTVKFILDPINKTVRIGDNFVEISYPNIYQLQTNRHTTSIESNLDKLNLIEFHKLAQNDHFIFEFISELNFLDSSKWTKYLIQIHIQYNRTNDNYIVDTPLYRQI